MMKREKWNFHHYSPSYSAAARVSAASIPSTSYILCSTILKWSNYTYRSCTLINPTKVLSYHNKENLERYESNKMEGVTERPLPKTDDRRRWVCR